MITSRLDPGFDAVSEKVRPKATIDRALMHD
jgi:hypothetical protein